MKRKRTRFTLVILLLALSVVCEWTLFTGQPPTPGGVSVVIAAASGPATPIPSPVFSPTPSAYARPEFQAGISFPQWGPSAYSPANRYYERGLREILYQTGARWVQLAITFEQDSYNSTTVQIGAQTPTPATLLDGIRTAHSLGLRVFVVPLITLRHQTPWHSQWAGDIRCASDAKCTAWFASYWSALKPYLMAAQAGGAEQFAIGTEFENLAILPTHYWTQLLSNVTSVYSGALTYDLNFSFLQAHTDGLPLWLKDRRLTAIGVSSYFSLVDQPVHVDPAAMPALWAKKVQAPLDALSAYLGKPVLISEIGYRNSADALYKPYMSVTTAHADPTEQAGIYRAAVSDAVFDPHILGIYFWAWSLPPFAPNGLPAASELRTWYTAPWA